MGLPTSASAWTNSKAQASFTHTHVTDAQANFHSDIQVHGFDDQTGTPGDDFLIGTQGTDHLVGLNGNDELVGLGHDDTLDGGNGDDILVGMKGDDLLLGRDGHDIILPGVGNDTMVGGLGEDWAYFHDPFGSGEDATGVTVDLSTRAAQDTGMGMKVIIGFEDVIGTTQSDHITGDAGNNLLSGWGGGGTDTLEGGGGNDYLLDVSGVTLIADGGEGVDTLSYHAGSGLKIHLNHTDAQVVDHAGDSLTISNVENVSGFYYNDVLVGTSGDNALYGDFGNDLLRGGFGNDKLYGDGYSDGLGAGETVTDAYSVGDDTLIGGSGNDTLDGGGGGDKLSGGFGANVFVYEFASDSAGQATGDIDHITDLTNQDSIDLTGLEANYGVTLSLVDTFDGAGPEVTLSYDKANDETYLKIDLDGDHHADMTIALDGDHRDFTNFVM